MQEKKYITDIGIYSIIISALIFLVGTSIAIITYPNYLFTKHSFSQLGVRNNTVYYSAAPYPWIFNYSIILSGILLIPSFPVFYVILRNDHLVSNLSLAISTLFGVLVGPFLFLIGIYDASRDIELHSLFASSLYLIIVMTCLFWTLGIKFMSDTNRYKQEAYISIDYLLLLILGVSSWIIFTASVPNVPILSSITLAAYQKIMAYVFVTYFGIVAYRIKSFDL